MSIASKARTCLGLAILLVIAATFDGCAPRSICDMTPDGSVWLTVVRLVWAEKKFYDTNHRYGALVEMTNLLDGLPPDVTAGRMGSYTITIELNESGYVLRANPDRPQSRRALASFYGDQTELITFNRSGRPAGPHDERM